MPQSVTLGVHVLSKQQDRTPWIVSVAKTAYRGLLQQRSLAELGQSENGKWLIEKISPPQNSTNLAWLW